MAQRSQAADENWKLVRDVQVPPFRRLNEFLLDKRAFGLPPFRDLGKWNDRMLNNLLYYQTNYFAMMLFMMAICASVQLRHVCIGSLAISLLVAALVFSLSSKPAFVQARHEHTFITLGAIVLSFYFFIYAVVSVVTVLFTVSLPMLLVLLHASTRLRNLKVKMNHQLERLGQKNTAMAFLLERCGVQLKI